MPELVSQETGVLSHHAADLADAVRHPERFDPEICRRSLIEKRLTHLDMARSYLACYERILTRGCLGDLDEPCPQTRPGFEANQLLDWDD
jgi:hypothetical protein